jgi:NAD+ synthase (glutamine-hydrolysing)
MSVRIALAQVNPTVGDLDGNRSIVVSAIAEAKRQGADLVALPELVITGYPPEDLLLRASFVEDNLEALSALASSTEGIAAIIGFVDRSEEGIHNAAAVISEGGVQAVYRKHRLPNYGVFDEERYFEPGDGLILAKLGGTLIGVTVCEDVWSEQGPHVGCAAAGADLIVNINGSPYHEGKGAVRQQLLTERALSLNTAFAYVNMFGGQDELVFDGQSIAVDAQGAVIARAAQFEEELLVFDFEPTRVDSIRRPGSSAEAVRIVNLGEPKVAENALASRVAREMPREEAVYHALVLGVRDYLEKNGFVHAYLGLSGGIDSSLTAAIAADALGPQNVTGVLMPSEFTSDESLDLGKRVASNLGINVELAAIGDVHKAFREALDPIFGGEGEPLANENLQPRIRGTLLMALSNNRPGSIVLSTGNKSELAMGYSTLYGDMAGGFAVLKDVAKTLVYELAHFCNRSRDAIPQEVIDRPPTAELRPNQLDTDSLPPYDVLDPILEAYVEDDKSVDEIVAMGYDEPTVLKVARSVDLAEYKRRQAPLGIKITEKAFGRDRRLPITNRYLPKR